MLGRDLGSATLPFLQTPPTVESRSCAVCGGATWRPFHRMQIMQLCCGCRLHVHCVAQPWNGECPGCSGDHCRSGYFLFTNETASTELDVTPARRATIDAPLRRVAIEPPPSDTEGPTRIMRGKFLTNKRRAPCPPRQFDFRRRVYSGRVGV